MEITRGQILQVVADSAFHDPDYRTWLLSDPRGLLAYQLGREIPDFLKIEVVEDTPQTVHLVCPYHAHDIGELNDNDLETITGGKLFDNHVENRKVRNCSAAAGGGGIAMASKMTVTA